MKITISAIGRMKKSDLCNILESYRKRIPWDINIKEMEEKRPLPKEKLMKSESDMLLASIPQGSKKIVLDEKGENLTSIELSQKLEKWKDEGSNITFLIGGANGHDKVLLEQADYKLSLGGMTWPHMLIRVMLMEQIYRAYSILNSHPYHRE